MSANSSRGFTLLEIFIALFIFTIITMLVVSGLHAIMTTQSKLENNASRFEELQLAIVLMERDFQQAIDRSITNANNSEESAFIGSKQRATFTTAGFINPFNQLPRSTLQRIQYDFKNHSLIRTTWSALDQTKYTSSSTRKILSAVKTIQIKYLDEKNHFQNTWPPSSNETAQEVLPRAVQVSITLNDLGEVSQLFVIAAHKIAKNENKTQ